MTARNDITGDIIATKGTTDAYRDNYDRIFGKKTESMVGNFGDSSKEQLGIKLQNVPLPNYREEQGEGANQ